MVDALCLEDLDLFGTELDDPLAELYQDLFHRLIERPGSNIDDPDRGFGLEQQLSGGVRPADALVTLQHGIEGELRKDDRVHDVKATVTTTAPGEYAINIQVQCDEGVMGITLVKDGDGVRRVA